MGHLHLARIDWELLLAYLTPVRLIYFSLSDGGVANKETVAVRKKPIVLLIIDSHPARLRVAASAEQGTESKGKRLRRNS